MSLWGTYSDAHPEIDLKGERQSLRALAERLSGGQPSEALLDEPPPVWGERGFHALEAIRFSPSDNPADLILLRREGAVLVIAGGSEVGRIIGGSILDLAEAPYRVTENSVPTHLHLDPTSDPEHNYYSPDSSSLVVNLADEE